MAAGEVKGDARELRQMLADCAKYLKEGETPAQRIERERRDTEAVLNLLVREKQRTEAMKEVMQRMVSGIEHLAEIARLWEPDHSSGQQRRGWLLALYLNDRGLNAAEWKRVTLADHHHQSQALAAH